MYHFWNWINENHPAPQPVRVQYDELANQLLYEQPGGYWTPTPPSQWLY